MIVHVLRWFSRPSPLQRARQARLDALKAVSEAKRRGDTRTQHEASQRARVATHEVIRLELKARGSSRSQPISGSVPLPARWAVLSGGRF